MLANCQAALGNAQAAEASYQKCLESFRDEVALFDKLGKGGKFKVRPVDRQFATFCATHHMFANDALQAAQRDLANRPDGLAKQNLKSLLAQTSHSGESK